MPRLSYYTEAVSVNYFLSVSAVCKVTQSCVITILNKLPNLTALHFADIILPANEMKVSVHNVQMQCIHVCAVTQSAQHACVYIVSCARGLRNEGVSSTFSQVSWPWIYQFWHAHMQSIPLYIQSVDSELDCVPIFLCPLHSPYEFGFGQLSFSWCVWWHHMINFHCPMELG